MRLQRTVPRRTPPRRTAAGGTSFPLFPALAATLLLLGVGQAALWWWSGRLPGVPTYVSTPRPAPTATAARPAPPQRLVALPLPQNIQFGDALGSVVVTYFTDPACGECRTTTQALAARLPVHGVRQVYKFWPQDPTRTTPGLLMELARRDGVVLPFWNALHRTPDDLNDNELLKLLEQAGLSLGQIRGAFRDHYTALNTQLTPDLELARNAGLPPPPVVVLDGDVLDSRSLTPALLAALVNQRLEGRTQRREEDLWLMQR